MVTGRAGLFTGGTTIDARVCAEIGAQLATVRAERGLTVAAVAEKLLLSPRQVRALESVDPSAFHNTTFYISGLRKYAAFAEVDPRLLERAATSEPMELVPGHADPPADVEDQPSRSPWSWLVIGLSIAALAAVAYFRPQLMTRSKPASAPSSQTGGAAVQASPPRRVPASVIAESVPVAPPPLGQVAAEAAAAGSPAELGSVRVPRATWLFLRYVDNTTVERPLGDGETAVFEKEPVYLAVGAPDAEITLGGRHVNVVPFVVNGQLRMRAPDIRSLLAGEEPAPDSTPDAPAPPSR